MTQQQLDRFIVNLYDKISSKSNLKKILIVPPDYSRFSSGAGFILDRICRYLFSQKSEIAIDILPATGLHQPMSAKQQKHMFGDFVVQKCSFLVHDPNDPNAAQNLHNPQDSHDSHDPNTPNNSRDFLAEKKEKFLKASFEKEELKKLFPNLPDFLCRDFTFYVSPFLDPSRYDAVFSLGQVLPHEVVGMANYTKNIVIGLGTKELIDFSHLASALIGMENIIGKIKNPVRTLIDRAFEKIALENHFKKDFIHFLLFTSVFKDDRFQLKSIYESTNDEAFSACCKDALQFNVSTVDKPVKLVIVDLPKHCSTTWIANKSIYRLRNIVEKSGHSGGRHGGHSGERSGGRLIIIAPHLKSFGESATFDKQIREIGYCSAKKALAFLENPPENPLQNPAQNPPQNSSKNPAQNPPQNPPQNPTQSPAQNPLQNPAQNPAQKNKKISAAVVAHLIHGYVGDDFEVIYATDSKKGLSKKDIEKVGYQHMNIEKARNLLDDVQKNSIEGMIVKDPAQGFWLLKKDKKY